MEQPNFCPLQVQALGLNRDQVEEIAIQVQYVAHTSCLPVHDNRQIAILLKLKLKD